MIYPVTRFDIGSLGWVLPGGAGDPAHALMHQQPVLLHAPLSQGKNPMRFFHRKRAAQGAFIAHPSSQGVEVIVLQLVSVDGNELAAIGQQQKGRDQSPAMLGFLAIVEWHAVAGGDTDVHRKALEPADQ